jgi:hypothetical protein
MKKHYKIQGGEEYPAYNTMTSNVRGIKMEKLSDHVI